MDLILTQARHADALLILSRPQLLEPEEWVLQIFKERPELAERTVVVFNQADTADITQLFSREGFLTAYEESARRLSKLGVGVNNLFISCARLPFLELSLNVPGANKTAIGERVVKLRTVLDRIRKATDSRPEGIFKKHLLNACNGKDCGIEPVRQRLQQLAAGPIYRDRFLEGLSALDRAAAAADSPVWWQPLQTRAAELRSALRTF